jgi:hypothetical protein
MRGELVTRNADSGICAEEVESMGGNRGLRTGRQGTADLLASAQGVAAEGIHRMKVERG